MPIPAHFTLDLQSIDLIIFDLGGVLLDIDYGLTQQAFADLGLADVDALYSKAAQSSLFDDIERGTISPADFRKGLCTIIGKSIEDHAVDKAWNALIQRLPRHRIETVKRLKTRYKTCLLSNTNDIHVTAFEQAISETIGLELYQSAFDEIYYSSHIGQRKPDAAAFQYVLQAMGVKAERSLFIDDSEQHIRAARAMGIQALHLHVGEEDISDLLAPLLDGLT